MRPTSLSGRICHAMWFQLLGQMLLFIHPIKKLIVVLGLTQLVEQELHAVLNTHGIEDAAEHPHFRELVLANQKFFFARA